MIGKVDARTIKDLYVDEGLPRDIIARRLGLSNTFVTRSLRQSGVEIRPKRTPTIVTELVTSAPHSPRIVIDRGQVVVKHQIRLTMKLAYTLGWILGDGYANRREVDAIVSERERSLIEPVVKRVLKRFGNVYVVPRHGVFIIRCNSTVLSRSLCSYKGARYWENIDFILQSQMYARSLIAGFWDADGGVYREANGTLRAHLYNSNLLLLDKIADAMQTMYGIEVAIYKRKDSENSSSSKIHARLDRFDLYVKARSNRLWTRHISRLMLLPWKKPVRLAQKQ
ncbi:MAG: hypothetical protein LYZ69_09785 [Nitrososphaerales archaeon]|nr:hypothetical protein [Nitrososphaerales archaeon]